MRGRATIIPLLWRIGNFLCRRLPIRLNYWVASIVADIVYLGWPRGRRYAKITIRHVLGREASSRQVARAARQSLRNYYKYLVDFLRFRDPLEMESHIQISGWDNLDRAFKKGKGVILVGLHFGNWDMAAAAVAHRKYPVNVIFEEVPNNPLNQMAREVRQQMGMKTIPIRNAIQLVRALRRNEMIALLIDQPHATSSVPVSFFDEQARIPSGPAALALMSGAEVIPGALVRANGDSYQGFIDSQVDVQRTGNREEDVQLLTQRIVSSLEKMVRQYPDQWYVFRKLWGTN